MNRIPSISEFGNGSNRIKRDTVYAEEGTDEELTELAQQFSEYGPEIEVVEIDEDNHVIYLNAERAAALSETSEGAAVLLRALADTLGYFGNDQD